MTFKNEFAQCGNGHTVFWMPVLDANDEPYDKEKFPPYVINTLKQRADVWYSQYLLRKPGDIDSIFDEEKIIESMYSWSDPHKTVLSYKGFEFDPDQLDEHGFAVMETKPAKVHLHDCRFFMHVDAKHKLQSQSKAAGKGQRPSEAATLIVAIAPDHHIFPVDYWHKDAGLDGLVAQMLFMYTRWAPQKVTWESVGAQFWLREHVVKMEKFDPRYRHPQAHTRYGMTSELPKMSSRMVEAEKTNQSKEFIARANLSSFINTGVLHVHEKQEALLHQLLHILDDKEAVDLVDCLGQGPPVWSAPPAPGLADDLLRRKAFITSFMQGGSGTGRAARHPAGGQGRTQFRRPW